MGQMVLTFICSVAGLAFAIYLAKWVLRHDEGTKEMRAISDAIREGAEAFLARQYKTIAYLTIPVAVVIWLLYALRQSSGQEHISTSQLAWYVAGSFIVDVPNENANLSVRRRACERLGRLQYTEFASCRRRRAGPG